MKTSRKMASAARTRPYQNLIDIAQKTRPPGSHGLPTPERKPRAPVKPPERKPKRPAA